MTLRPERFFDDLNRLFPEADFLIAYSGGLDSSVLLHLCVSGAGNENRARFLAVHLNHGLHPQSGRWAEFCQAACARLNIDFRMLTLDIDARPGQSLEEAARSARYTALLRLMSEKTVLLTAQHRDDQAETILLQLLRGGGLRGLSGMPGSIAFGPGILHRPLLDFSKNSIRSYAAGHELDWIEDPSNADTTPDRNYLRHVVIPRIRERWSGMAKTLARSGTHCAEAEKIIDSQVESWFGSVVNLDRNTIGIIGLREFNETQKRLILRHWIRRSGFRSPSLAVLQRILDEGITASPDRSPKVQWPEAEVRRYRDELHLMRPLSRFDRNQVIEWSLSYPLSVPDLGGTLECHCRAGDSALPVQKVSVRFRNGGESCRLPGRKGSRSLKDIFRELRVPPWERDRTPLIYVEEKLAAIGDRVICEPFAGSGIEIHWVRQ